ncbi:ion channel [Nocardiopsis sp. RSe5-2]|uniref:Ion channel n=1 Tax=Nocardiopsis endophytica TaxID=3018445 RepID=A0ABT4U9I4_9ACTN|nr:potassium channel family protein [Nocardiopsis endophytica]MDA2813613.1 ion channel [Nocardiopsis endophytica]
MPDTYVKENKLETWRRRTFVPLLAASLVFFAAYAWPIIDPGLSDTWRVVCEAAIWSVWAVFAVDYAARLALAPRKGFFIRRNWFDLLVIVLPVLRPLRLVQVILVLGFINKRARMVTLRRSVAWYAGAGAVLLVVCAALAVLDAERASPDAVITDFPEALWWAATTVTTVGYGDFYPVTLWGRVVAIVLFTAGIALLGVVTGTLASWFVEKLDTAQETASATQGQVEDLMEEVRALRAELAARTAPRPQAEGPGAGPAD